MAVFEDADGGFTPTLINSLIGALNVFALTVMILSPLVLGAMLGYWTTERLDDPERVSIEANLPNASVGVSRQLVIDTKN
ncbi:MAG: hypothetical protein P8N43_07475 [Alphaproteobacteria bacterium]|nr:hypothetical protein [Alphaproteobacteria bacterium]